MMEIVGAPAEDDFYKSAAPKSHSLTKLPFRMSPKAIPDKATPPDFCFFLSRFLLSPIVHMCRIPGVDPHAPQILWIEHEENWGDWWLCRGWLVVQPTLKTCTTSLPMGLRLRVASRPSPFAMSLSCKSCVETSNFFLPPTSGESNRPLTRYF